MRSWIVLTIVAVLCGAAALVVREQRRANRELRDALVELQKSVEDRTRRERDLAQRVAALAERASSLEAELTELRRRALVPSGAEDTASAMLLEGAALSPLAPFPEPANPGAAGAAADEDEASRRDAGVVETLPIRWHTDPVPYQPAGIAAPAPALVVPQKLTDPAFVKTLYVTYAALQAADIISTTAALRTGSAREANPFVRGYAHSPAAMIGVKAAVSVGTVLALERVRAKHPVIAGVTLIAINATLAAVVANNAAIAARAPSR